MRATLAGAALAAGIYAYYVYRSRKRAPALPVTLKDKQGQPVVVRLATPDDLEAVKTSIADHTGTGSGTGGDDFLIQEFSKNVSDPNYTVLFAETLDGIGLGMTIIAWSGSSLDGVGQSYWQSLRVAQASRGRGIASLLFKLSARFAIERQGPKSVARWGIVSNNSIMMNWSQKSLKLHGPEAFRRYGAPASDAMVELPSGYTMRAARNDDADRALILKHVKAFTIAKSAYGTQNFLRVGWGEFTEVRGNPCA